MSKRRLRNWIWAVAALVGLAANGAVANGPVTNGAAETVFPSGHWEESTPDSQSLDPQRLAAAVDYLKQNSGRDGVRELVIIRNGRMVWKGEDIDKVHGIWSCTKSFTRMARFPVPFGPSSSAWLDSPESIANRQRS